MVMKDQSQRWAVWNQKTGQTPCFYSMRLDAFFSQKVFCVRIHRILRPSVSPSSATGVCVKLSHVGVFHIQPHTRFNTAMSHVLLRPPERAPSSGACIQITSFSVLISFFSSVLLWASFLLSLKYNLTRFTLRDSELFWGEEKLFWPSVWTNDSRKDSLLKKCHFHMIHTWVTGSFPEKDLTESAFGFFYCVFITSIHLYCVLFILLAAVW